MSRDVLLALLALALLVNLAFLSQVATLRTRRDRNAALDREAAWHREAARRAAASRTVAARVVPADSGRTFFVPLGAGNGSGRAPAPDAAATTNGAPPPVVLNAAPLAVLPATTAVTEPPLPMSEPVSHGADATEPTEATDASEIEHEPPAVDAAATTTDAGARKSRGRRFVLPPLDEDQDRSAAAIEAFLDGSLPPGASAERRQRRRHRARRPAGTPVPRTTMLVWLHGFDDIDKVVGTARANHVSNAFVDALRRSARSSDEIREAGAGRVRVIIDADDAGTTAYVERARASVQPWLDVLAVPLRVETGVRQSTEFVSVASRRAVVDR